MEFLEICKIKRGRCIDCRKKATKSIGGVLFCAHCGDTVLMNNIKNCIKAIEEARVGLLIRPKSKYK